MFNNINNNSKRLSSTERIQPSSPEIYTAQNIPTGETMPEYTRTHTSTQSIDTYILQERAFKQVRAKLLSDIYVRTEDHYCDWFLMMQEECPTEIALLINDLKCQCIEVYAMKLHHPLRADYNKLIRKQCKKLKSQAPHIPFEKYCKEGANFTAAAGAYLLSIYNKKSEKQLRLATIQLSGLQWLIGERDALPVEVTSTAPQPDIIETTATHPQEPTVEEVEVVEEDTVEEDTVEEDTIEEEAVEQQPLNEEDEKLVNAFNKLREKKDKQGNCIYTLGKIYPTLHHIYKTKNIPWAKNKRQFAEHIAPLLSTTSPAIQTACNRIDEEVKGIALDTLREHITQSKAQNPRGSTTILEKYAELYETAQALLE